MIIIVDVQSFRCTVPDDLMSQSERFQELFVSKQLEIAGLAGKLKVENWEVDECEEQPGTTQDGKS